MSKVGFEDVIVDVFSSDRVANTRNEFNNSMTGAFAGMMIMFVKVDGEASYWGSEAAAQLYADAASELANGKSYYRVELNVVCAHKAQ
jgi:hypothetical protein